MSLQNIRIKRKRKTTCFDLYLNGPKPICLSNSRCWHSGTGDSIYLENTDKCKQQGKCLFYRASNSKSAQFGEVPEEFTFFY